MNDLDFDHLAETIAGMAINAECTDQESGEDVTVREAVLRELAPVQAEIERLKEVLHKCHRHLVLNHRSPLWAVERVRTLLESEVEDSSK